MELKDQIITEIKKIYDPEIPVNIYELGLIYDIKVEGRKAEIKMTLTTPNCPVAESLPKEVKDGDILVTPKGVEVNETYRATVGGNTLSKALSIYPVTNMEHETYLNEVKRLIALPSITLIEFFEDNFAELVDYVPNKEVDRNGDKKTINSFASRFLDRADYRRSAPTTVSRTGEATGANVTFDNGPSSTTATAGVVSKT